MRKSGFIIVFLLTAKLLSAQKAWITPAGINPDDTITIWADISKCDCQRLKGSTGPLYFYTWLPGLVSDTSSFYNGIWENSNEKLRMTRFSGDIWYYKLVPTRFYGVSAVTVFEKDFAFRVKMKDGTGIGGSGCEQDATEALYVNVSPLPPVAKRIYSFPAPFSGDSLSILPSDMLTIWYDNRLETKDSLKGKTDFYLYIETTATNGQTYRVTPYGSQGNNPALAMKQYTPGLFRKGLIPAELFNGTLPTGVKPATIRIQVTRKVVRTGSDVVDEIHIRHLNTACD